jgi:hypothetical protein
MTAVPDPRFRDQLEDVLVQSVGAQMPRGKVWRPGIVIDALLPLIAAHVEAQVQAATNQRAADELTRVTEELGLYEDAARIRAALAQPASEATEAGR